MNINEVYKSNSDYLKAEDIKGKGQVPVTIAAVTPHEFDEGTKLIVGFVGKDKCMVLNKTNASVIAEILGPDTDDWIGGNISLYAARVEFQGKIVDGLRVVLPQGMISGEAPPPPPNHPATGDPHPADTASAAEDDKIPFAKVDSRLI